MREMRLSLPRALAPVLALGLFVGSVSAAELPAPLTLQGHFQEIALDNPGSGPAIVSVDDEDRVWVALARAGKLAMLSNGRVRTFDLGPDSRPVGVIAGTRKNGYPGEVWIAASYDNKIIRYDWQSGQKREYPIPGTDSWPFNIALDAQGQVWFTQRAAGAIGRLDPVSGQVTNLPLPRPSTGPAGLGIDLRNGKVWFTQSYADTVASLDPATGTVTELPMGTTSTGLITGPAGLAVDAQGGVWFAKLEGKLGYVAPGSREVQLIPTPPGALRPAGLAIDAQGDVWMGALDGNSLIRYQPASRQFSVYPLPVGGVDVNPSAPPAARTSRPFGLAFDSTGNLWFTQQYTGQLGMLALARPELKLFSPGPEVMQPDPYVTVQALSTGAGAVELAFELDGQKVQAQAGRLDLARAAPGPHELKVTATDRAGNASTASRRFNYAPAPDAVPAIVRGLRLKDEAPAAFRDALAMSAREPNNARRLEDVRDMLATHREQLQDGEYAQAAATLDWIARASGLEQVVTILDRAPFFAPGHVKLRPGGSVSWQYRSEMQGHQLSHELHQIEVPGLGVKSPLLRSGDRFVHRFEKAGEYTAVDSRRPGAVLQIVVQK